MFTITDEMRAAWAREDRLRPKAIMACEQFIAGLLTVDDLARLDAIKGPAIVTGSM